MDFSGRLKILRALSRKTQEQVALDCEWKGQSRVSNYESGTRLPRLDEIEALAASLNAPARVLVANDDLLEHLFQSHAARYQADTLVAAAASYLDKRESPASLDELLARYAEFAAKTVVALPDGKAKRGGKGGLVSERSKGTQKTPGGKGGRRKAGTP